MRLNRLFPIFSLVWLMPACSSLIGGEDHSRVRLSYVCSGSDVGQCNYVLFSEGRKVSQLVRLRQGQIRTLTDLPVTTRYCMSSGEEPFPDPRTCRQFYFTGKPVQEPTSI